MQNEEFDSSGFNKRLGFYMAGFFLTGIGHTVFEGNSHTPALSFAIILLFIIVGIPWLIVDYFKDKPKAFVFTHLTCLFINWLIILLLIS